MVKKSDLRLAFQHVSRLCLGKPVHDSSDGPKWTRQIMDAVRYHQLTPTALGWRNEGTTSKLSAALWSIGIQCGLLWSELHLVLQTVRSWTTDMGSELGFNDFRAEEVYQLCPFLDADDGVGFDSRSHAIHTAPAPGASDSDIDCDVGSSKQPRQHQQGSESPEYDLYDGFADYAFPGSLRVAGFLHIGHGALESVCSELDSWPRIREQMTQVCRMFGNIGSILAFSQTLLVGDCARYRKLFEQEARCPEFLDWRWRSLVRCAWWLLKRETPIRKVWNRKAFEDGITDEKRSKSVEGVRMNLAVITQAIQSEYWWRYLDMLGNNIGALGEELASWMSRCPCHRGLGTSQSEVSRRMKSFMKEYLTDTERREASLPCPLAGKLAPEVALGHHLEFISGKRFSMKLDLLNSLAAGSTSLGQEDVDLIIADFLRAFDRFIVTVQLKLDFTQALPFSLCGLATADEDAAKQHAKKLMAQFDSIAGAASHRAHDRVSVAWLGAGRARSDLEAWSSTEAKLCDFPALELEVAALRFVPLCEWDAERPHSVLKRAVMGKASKGVRASLAMRDREIRCVLRDKVAYTFFQQVFDMHSDIYKLLVELGVTEHPTVLDAIRSRQAENARRASLECTERKEDERITQSFRKHLGALLYHLDPVSQLMKFSDATKFNEKCKRRTQDSDDKFRAKAMRVATLSRLIADQWWQHLQAQLSPGQIVEIPDDVQIHMQELQHFQNSLGHLTADVSMVEEADEIDADVALANRNGEPLKQCFFRIVHANPGAQKLIRRRAGAGQTFNKGDMVLTTVGMREQDGARFVQVFGPSQSCLSVARALPAVFDALRAHDAMLWDVEPQLHYCLSEIPGASHILGDMVRCGAFKEESAMHVPRDDDKSVALTAMQRCGYVVAVRDGGAWYLSAMGICSLSMFQKLSAGMLLCRPADGYEEKPIPAMSNFELLCFLEAKGWTWLPLPPAKGRTPECIVLSEESAPAPRDIYGGFKRAYIHALVIAERDSPSLVRRGYNIILQFQDEEYYKTLVDPDDVMEVACLTLCILLAYPASTDCLLA